MPTLTEQFDRWVAEVRSTDPGTAILAHFALADFLANVGSLDEARSHLTGADALIESSKLEKHEVPSLLLLVRIIFRRGREAEARILLGRARDQIRRQGPPLLGRLSEIEQAAGLFRLGKIAEARTALQSVGRAEDLVLPEADAVRLAWLAAVFARDGAGLHKALERSSALPGRFLHFECSWALAQFYLELGNEDNAREYALEAATVLQSLAAELPVRYRKAFWQDERRGFLLRGLQATLAGERTRRA